MTRRRSLIALLCALAAVLALPAGAAAQSIEAHGDPAAELPDDLITRPVLQDRWSSLQPGLGTDNERSGGLPETWCGDELAATFDDTVDQFSSPTGPQCKLVYAYASDQTDRFAQAADKLQASVLLLTRYMAGQSGGAKTVRFDLGTSCGPQYADIQKVALPNPKSYYVLSGAPNFTRLRGDIRAATGLDADPTSRRDVIVYADALRGTDGISGTGERWIVPGVADVPDASNPHNAGNLLSVAWGPDTTRAAPTRCRPRSCTR